MLIETMEDVSEALRKIIVLFVEFRSLRDVSQDLGSLETEIAMTLEGSLSSTKFDSEGVSARMEAFQQRLEGLKIDVETLLYDVNEIVEEIIYEVAV